MHRYFRYGWGIHIYNSSDRINSALADLLCMKHLSFWDPIYIKCDISDLNTSRYAVLRGMR